MTFSRIYDSFLSIINILIVIKYIINKILRFFIIFQIHFIQFLYSYSPLSCEHFTHPTLYVWPKHFCALDSTLEASISSNIEFHQFLFHFFHSFCYVIILRTPLCMFDNYFLRRFFASASTLEAYIGPNIEIHQVCSYASLFAPS